MGRGIVDPVDDFQSTNPPSNAKLLDFLASDFIEHGFDRKQTLRLILNSRTYQRSVVKNPSNAGETKNFASAQVRLIAAEPLFDAIGRVTEVLEPFNGVPQGHPRDPDADPPSDGVFRSLRSAQTRDSLPVRARRRADALSGPPAPQRPGRPEAAGRPQEPDSSTRSDAGKDTPAIVEECYLAALCRTPHRGRTSVPGPWQYIAAKADRSEGLEDVLWAIMNSKEFIFQH